MNITQAHSQVERIRLSPPEFLLRGGRRRASSRFSTSSSLDSGLDLGPDSGLDLEEEEEEGEEWGGSNRARDSKGSYLDTDFCNGDTQLAISCLYCSRIYIPIKIT